MRLRAVCLIAALASVAAVLAVAGPASATANWSCGEVFTSSPAPLNNNLDCSGINNTALHVSGDNVTLNFNGHTVTGWSGSCAYNDVIDNNSGYSGLVVENGTIVDGGCGYGVDIGSGMNNTVANMTIDAQDGAGYEAVHAYAGSDGLTVTGSTITGTDGIAIYADGNGMTISNDTITPYVDTPAIEAYEGLGDVISGNTVTGNFNGSTEESAEIGIHLYKDTGALVENNTVGSMGEWGFYESASAGTQLTDNTFDSNFYGVGFDGAINPNSDNTVSGNFIRNSYYEGVDDYQSDLNSYSGNVATNNGIECGTSPTSECAGFFINPGDYGSVTLTNNYSRLSSWGFLVENAYDGNAFASTRSMISGNSATYDDFGFGDSNSKLATWSGNTAYGNNDFGYYFEEPTHETISNNSAYHNGGEGFFFGDNAPPHNPLAVTNNVAEYNGDYGFDADYPLGASSGNTGSNTNGTDDCWYVAGCS